MPGKGKINEYNQSLTPEERKTNAKKAGKASVKKRKTIADIAKVIAASPTTNEDARRMLSEVGVTDEDMTNDALITLSVFRSAVEGDMRAVEKWERYTGQSQLSKQEKLELELLREKVKQLKGDNGKDAPDDGFIAALNGAAAEDWSDEDE